MVSSSDPNSEVLHEFLFFNVLKDGRVNIFNPPSEKIPPADDPATGVKIRDVKISGEVSARLFLPSGATAGGKVPVLVYVHGGGFCMGSAFSPEYTNLANRLAAAGEILIVSVEYGLFPSRPIPACYDDSWEALRWLAAGADGDPWINNHADLGRLYIGGDSAGGNICHTLAVREASEGLPGGVRIEGMILIHPYFHFGEGDKMWMYMCPENEGTRDRRMRPAAEDLGQVACARVLVLIAEKDELRDAGKRYYEELKKSGYKGRVELVENRDKDHCFHVKNPDDEEAAVIQQSIVDFIHHKNE